MKEYQIYRTNGTRTLTDTIAHPTASYNFSVTVPDLSAWISTFVLTAVDTNNNESLESTPTSDNDNLDKVSPDAVKNLTNYFNDRVKPGKRKSNEV